MLDELFEALADLPFRVQWLKHCDFLDFGGSRAILSNGTRLLQEDRGISFLQGYLDINNELRPKGSVQGTGGWVEGCRIASSLALGGSNVVVGVDVEEPLSLAAGACVDVIEGHDRDGDRVWFVRCYGIDDAFKEPAGQGAVFCGRDLLDWLAGAGAGAEDVWDRRTPERERSIWNARLFPAVKAPGEYRRWLWMFEPGAASDEARRAWRSADRYSFEQMLAMADHVEFYRRRSAIRAGNLRGSWRRVFRPESRFSARELAYLLRGRSDRTLWIADILKEVHRYSESGESRTTAALVLPRVMHSLGTALRSLCEDGAVASAEILGGVEEELTRGQVKWLKSLGLLPSRDVTVGEWADRARSAAFESLERSIVGSGIGEGAAPRSVLRSDEIVWARAPARLDVGGGWTDTPPYALEWGGCVMNAAVNLNGQPPIQAYVRVIEEPVIRIGSIDLGVRIEVRRFEDLLDYRKATGSFALAKAALVLSGLAPQGGGRPKAGSLKKALEAFGGGIELTTLAAIPKGSGLGTSSIMGAVITAAIARVVGKTLSQRELFHQVLRLEQALTTGGGWQDQIGGVVDGVKMIVSEAGMVPDAHIHYVPEDILDPSCNENSALLYYTGITRLAKNILQQVVGRYLDRDRATVATLTHIGAVAREVMDTFIRKDRARFGRLVDTAWRLNKQLDPNSSNAEIEALLARVAPHLYGAKLLGAGGGGFLLMICQSGADAAAVREMLEAEPPNERARFFDYSISDEGLVVTVS